MSGGISVWGSLSRGSLSRRSLVWGSLSVGSLSIGGGLWPGGSLSIGGSLARGSLSRRPPRTVTSGRYASCWNKFLFFHFHAVFDKIMSKDSARSGAVPHSRNPRSTIAL